ncbi:hypothetical protein OC842_006697, partial [Tilletia horrida]
VVAYLALALSALLPLTVLAAAEQGSDIDAGSYLRALNALGAVKIHADPSTIELHEDKRDGTRPLTRRGLDEVNRKDKHLVDKEKLELMKKIHDKEIKAASLLRSFTFPLAACDGFTEWQEIVILHRRSAAQEIPSWTEGVSSHLRS